MDLKQRFAILNEKKKIIKSICHEIDNKSGIYLFYRTNEENEKCSYVGQSKNVWNRCADHILWTKGKTQYIDKSLYSHKLYNENNKCGWKLKILTYCDVSKLDEMEQHFINYFLKIGYKSYNVTGGGQFDKAEDIGKRYEVKLKSYKNGKNFAYDKAREYVKTMFNKYLDYTIKGKTNKIKERKLKEFEEFLGGTDE